MQFAAKDNVPLDDVKASRMARLLFAAGLEFLEMQAELKVDENKVAPARKYHAEDIIRKTTEAIIEETGLTTHEAEIGGLTKNVIDVIRRTMQPTVEELRAEYESGPQRGKPGGSPGGQPL
jgi:hypothetical protein